MWYFSPCHHYSDEESGSSQYNSCSYAWALLCCIPPVWQWWRCTRLSSSRLPSSHRRWWNISGYQGFLNTVSQTYAWLRVGKLHAFPFAHLVKPNQRRSWHFTHDGVATTKPPIHLKGILEFLSILRSPPLHGLFYWCSRLIYFHF